MSESEPFEWEEAPDLTAFSEEQLKVHLESFVSEEREVSYRRRILQGRIDLVRAELVRRGNVSASPGELARILLGDTSGAHSSLRSGKDEGAESGCGRGTG